MGQSEPGPSIFGVTSLLDACDPIRTDPGLALFRHADESLGTAKPLGERYLGQPGFQPHGFQLGGEGRQFLGSRLVPWNAVEDRQNSQCFLKQGPVDEPSATHDLEHVEVMLVGTGQAWIPGDRNSCLPPVLGFDVDLVSFDPESGGLDLLIILSDGLPRPPSWDLLILRPA